MATDWIGLIPVIILSAAGIIIFCLGAFWRRCPSDLLFALALAAAAAVAVVVLLVPPVQPTSENLLDLRGYARYFTFLIMAITMITLLFIRGYSRARGFAGDELYSLLIFAALGMVFAAGGENWVVFFLGLELLSLALYVLIAIHKHEALSNEAALKYFLMGAVASAFLVFGISLLYAMTGTLQIAASLKGSLAYPGQIPVIVLGLILILVGVGFKLSLAPFHLWTPDVYQGAPAPVTAFLSTGSKVALFAALMRFCLAVATPVWVDWCVPALWVLAVLTMLVGNITALYQTQVKRLLAYSSIGQMGYLFMTLVAIKGDGGPAAMMFYLAVYAVMDLGVFGLIGTFSRSETDLEDLRAYQGLGYTHPWRAAIFAACLISLAGLPPTAGFMGKWVLFRAVLNQGFIVLAVIGIIAVFISIYYYFKVIIHLYMREVGGGAAVPGPDLAMGLAGTVVFLVILWLGIAPGPLFRVIAAIVTTLPPAI